jgi:hypothetical protein
MTKIRTCLKFCFIALLLNIQFVLAQSSDGAKEKTSNSKSSGFICIAEGRLGISPDDKELWSKGAQLIFGYFSAPEFSIGAGVAYDSYNYSHFIPVFADFRYFFLDKKLSPYVEGSIGYALTNDESLGGTYLRPAIGGKLNLNNRLALNFSIGYRMQEFGSTTQISNSSSEQLIMQKFLDLTVGISF